MKKILVTGGTGFLGAYLLHYLVQKYDNIVAIKRASSPMNLVEDIQDKITWIDCDILDISLLCDIMQDIQQVYHVAAVISFDSRDREQMYKINIEGTANIVNACLYANVEKLLYVSSIAAIGRVKGKVEVTEKTEWEESPHNSAYAISKFNGEREVWRGIAEGLTAVIINPSVILGSGYWDRGSAKLFGQVNNGLKFYPTGATGFVDVRDVAKIMMLLMESDIEEERFIVNGDNRPYSDVLFQIADELGKKRASIKATGFLSGLAWRLEWLRSRLTGARTLITKETALNSSLTYQYDNAKVKAALGFEFIPLEETIREAAGQLKEGKEYAMLGIGELV